MKRPLRNVSYVALHAPLPTRHVSHQGVSSSLFIEASSARASGPCVLDKSTQNSVLASRSSASALDRSGRLLGQVDGPCGWAQDVCVNSFLYTQCNPSCVRPRLLARGNNGPRGALSAYGSTMSKTFSLNLSPCVLGHDELGCMYDA